MPRPKRHRSMETPPLMNGFKPFGTPVNQAESVFLLMEEYESLRLADYENFSQEQAAERMDISRPTFARIYDKARKTIAKAFVEGKAIFIEGGNVAFTSDWYRCAKCNHTFVSNKKKENCPNCASNNTIHINTSLNKTSEQANKLLTADSLSVANQDCSTEKTCICVNCSDTEYDNITQPCRLVNCSKCGSPLIRKDSHQYNLLKKAGIINDSI